MALSRQSASTWLAARRRAVHLQLDPRAWKPKGLSPLNRCVCVLIVLSVALSILETEPVIVELSGRLLAITNLAIGLVFVVEYVARLWVCVESPRYGSGLRGRLRYAVSPAALLDLIAILPVLAFGTATETFLLRVLRLLRILRLARLGQFSRAISLVAEAVNSRRYELVLSVAAALGLLVISSSMLYLVEGAAQPDTFGSIPRAMWWSIATLTTVGYGDVFPVTPFGKVFAAITAMTGIGLIAMPTGILAAAFSDAIQRNRGSSD